MQYNDFFNKEKLNILIKELSLKYNIDEIEVNDCINRALSESYGYERVVFNKDGSITALKKQDKFQNEIKHHNISKKIYKVFQNKLSNMFYKKSFEKIESKFKILVKKNNNILYGKIIEVNNEEIKLNLFDKDNNKINNFFVSVKKKSKYIFKNELYNDKYDINEGMLIYIPERQKIEENHGKFFIAATRKHPEIVRLKINSFFKEIKSKLGKSYGYEKVFINLKEKKITIISKLNFSEVVRKFLKDKLIEIDDFELTFINIKRG